MGVGVVGVVGGVVGAGGVGVGVVGGMAPRGRIIEELGALACD